jgi:hypothetical protein
MKTGPLSESLLRQLEAVSQLPHAASERSPEVLHASKTAEDRARGTQTVMLYGLTIRADQGDTEMSLAISLGVAFRRSASFRAPKKSVLEGLLTACRQFSIGAPNVPCARDEGVNTP